MHHDLSFDKDDDCRRYSPGIEAAPSAGRRPPTPEQRPHVRGCDPKGGAQRPASLVCRRKTANGCLNWV